METRKIQLIAGTTYSVSLPKDWVLKNRLKESNEVTIQQKNDGTLIISPSEIREKKLSEISLEVEQYRGNIDQILFALYYIGLENITLYSKKEMPKDVKAKIRKTLTHMSGTEISYEDSRKIVVKVLLDKSKVNVPQVIHRVSLITESTLNNLAEGLSIDEIRVNENEIDRLYHLLAKIITLALIDSNILHSSGINNVSLIPSYFLMSKKLEHIGDNASYLGEYLHENNLEVPDKEVVEFLKLEFHRATSHLMKKDNEIFDKIPFFEVEVQEKRIQKIKDSRARGYMENILRLLVDIEEEITNNSFYNQLIEEKVL